MKQIALSLSLIHISWAKDAMQWAVGSGLIQGTEENGKILLNPQGNSTRAQVAVILMRFLEGGVQ